MPLLVPPTVALAGLSLTPVCQGLGVNFGESLQLLGSLESEEGSGLEPSNARVLREKRAAGRAALTLASEGLQGPRAPPPRAPSPTAPAEVPLPMPRA